MYSESTLRRKAKEIGYRITKGYTRMNNRIGSVFNHDIGYSVTDMEYNVLVGGTNEALYNLWKLEDVEEFLHDQYNVRGLKL